MVKEKGHCLKVLKIMKRKDSKMYDLPQNSQKNSKKSDFQNSNAFEIADKNESFALDEIPQGLSPVSKALEYQKKQKKTDE